MVNLREGMVFEMQLIVKKMLSFSIIALLTISSFTVLFVENVKADGSFSPNQSNESPINGSSGVCPIPLLSVRCYDNDSADTMNATWWSNSSGSWIDFAVNTSIANDTFINQSR